MNKFGRKYKVTIETEGGESLIIEPPLTINFTIERGIQSSLNSMNLTIFNLSETVRKQIFKDRFSKIQFRRIILEAGYNELSTIFIGDLFEAHSVRQGNNILTNIVARDGNFDIFNTLTSKTLNAGITKKELLKNLIAGFPNLKEGKLGNIEGDFKRPVVLDGNTFELIKKYSEDQVFVDLEQVNILKDKETITGFVTKIDSSAGLLQTPKRSDAFLSVETIFEPAVIVGQLLDISSEVAPEWDGQYKVLGVKHSATISESIGGNATSVFNLLVGTQLFGAFDSV